MIRIPKVSVLTAAYNTATFIRETIESVAAQTYRSVEHIVVDDGSSDETATIAAEYEGVPGFRLIRQHNQGEAVALNRALEAASGDYIVAVSADDPIRPSLLEAAVSLLETDSSLVAVYPDWDIIDEKSRVVSSVRVQEFSLAAMVIQHICLPGPGTVIRRAALADTIFRDPTLRFKNDFDLWLRLGARAPMCRLPGIHAAWRRHPAGATSAKRGRMMAEEHIEVIRRAYERPGLPPDILQRKDLAFSVAHYWAGLQGLHAPEVNGRRYMFHSLTLAPRWPSDFHPEARRAWSRVAFLLTEPASRWIYDAGLALGLPLPRG